MLVSDLQTGNPPMSHVRMVPVRDVQVSPAADLAFIAVVEILQPVKIVQIPHYGGVFAVNFECVKRLVSAGITRSLKRGQRSVLKACQEQTCVVDADGFILS